MGREMAKASVFAASICDTIPSTMRHRHGIILHPPEVDPRRIGVMAISLGGYYAPRAAAFEQRFACCLAWGAQWDYQKIWRDRFERLARADTPSLSVAATHFMGSQRHITGRRA